MTEIWFLLTLVIIALIIPRKYDPAIRFKEWVEDLRGSKEK